MKVVIVADIDMAEDVKVCVLGYCSKYGWEEVEVEPKPLPTKKVPYFDPNANTYDEEKERSIMNEIDGYNRCIDDILENSGLKPLPKDENHEYYGCPLCWHIVSSVQNYCENCGQKLDWRGMGETE